MTLKSRDQTRIPEWSGIALDQTGTTDRDHPPEPPFSFISSLGNPDLHSPVKHHPDFPGVAADFMNDVLA